MRTATKFMALSLFVMMGVVASMQALPSGGSGFDDLYFSDASLTTAVGERYMECYSDVGSWGTLFTPYVQRNTWRCEDTYIVDCACKIQWCVTVSDPGGGYNDDCTDVATCECGGPPGY